MLTKITSKNGLTFLLNPTDPNADILTGESVLLSIYEPDNFYYQTNINIIKRKHILKEEEPTESEELFFYYMKSQKEINFSKTIIKEYNLVKYINFLPKIKFKKEIINNIEILIGHYKDPSYSQLNTNPKISIDNQDIILNEDGTFTYDLTHISKPATLIFNFDLPKYSLNRSYKYK